MIIASSPTFETWVAPPQENLPRPTCTKLIVGNRLLSNSIEYANWESDPVFPIVCEGCWLAECAQTELARIVQFGDYALWLRPRLEQLDAAWKNLVDQSNCIQQPVIMPKRVWDQLSTEFSSVPPFEKLRQPDLMDMLRLWLDEIPTEIQVVVGLNPQMMQLDELPKLLERECIAADPLSLEESVAAIRRLILEANETIDVSVDGELKPIGQVTTEINGVFFDAPRSPEWRVFTVAETDLVIGNQWMLRRRRDT